MRKTIENIDLAAAPSHLGECFYLLKRAGAVNFALFGGAVRDTDYGAHHGVPRQIKDYDVRLWLPAPSHTERVQEFLGRLHLVAGTVQEVPTLGSHHMRYCFDFSGMEMDLSIRPAKIEQAYPADVAIDRANDADIGLSSVAIDANGLVWAAREYMQDRNNRTLSVYPSENTNRLTEYTERMQQKFPDHTVVPWSNSPDSSSSPSV